uniref:Troponin I1, slow skeletal type n=1 Tax=Sus scrofa TaxID=9823 RepID=A0A8W4FK72_PIG
MRVTWPVPFCPGLGFWFRSLCLIQFLFFPPQRKPKITASRKLLLKSLMLAKAKECWEQEHEEREAEKARYLAERIPTLQTRGLSLSALQDLCRELHAKVEVVDEERYDIEAMSGMEGRKKMFDAAKSPTSQ